MSKPPDTSGHLGLWLSISQLVTQVSNIHTRTRTNVTVSNIAGEQSSPVLGLRHIRNTLADRWLAKLHMVETGS